MVDLQGINRGIEPIIDVEDYWRFELNVKFFWALERDFEHWFELESKEKVRKSC